MNLSASSCTDLLVKLTTIDIAVPPLASGRTKNHTEQWSICRFLSTYSDSDILQYPLQVTHRDRPDYELQMNGNLVGVEITASMPPQYAMAIAVRNKYVPDAPIESGFFTLDSPDYSEDEIIDILERSKKGLYGMGREKRWRAEGEPLTREKSQRNLEASPRARGVGGLTI